MTQEYTSTIGSSSWCLLVRLLLRWRGSVYKVLWGDLLVYSILYTSISCLYRFYLDDPHRKIFEEFVMQISRYRNQVPVSFMLGFYVWLAVSRWWNICLALPDNTSTAMLLATYIPGTDSRAFEIRSRVVRYINLTYAMVFARISPSVSKRFPDTQSFVYENFVTEMERQVLEEAKQYGQHCATWVPMTWCSHLVQVARDEGFLETDGGKKALVREINSLRRQCEKFLDSFQFNIPLTCTQVVTIVVYTYFLVSLVSEQFLDESLHYPNHEVDMVVPIFALLELIFYLGWLKVAVALLNPFSSDDHSLDLLKMLQNTRDSGFVICHMAYNQYSPDAQWRPKEEDRLRIIDLGVLTAWQRLEALSLEESYPKANMKAAFRSSLSSGIFEDPSAAILQ
ncbi:bestrophin-3-like [Panulirus ornatus]|uniref:bestrophin-3-like n=1 Tax=Panulirus ornatus TaxID=150431 RepID=UPI003A89B90B